MNRRKLFGSVAAAGLLTTVSFGPSGGALFLERASDTKLWVWTRTAGHRWIRYELRRFTNASLRLDAWRIQAISAVDLTGDAPVPGSGEVKGLDLTTGGNYEYALRLVDGSDHVGGLHGDELLKSFLLLADGRRAPAPGTVTALTTFELAQDTVLLDPDAVGTELGDMHVRHVFTSDGLRLRWDLDWKAGRAVEYAYGAMLPAVRSPTVTTWFRYLDRAVEHDISTAGHRAPPADSCGVQMYNTTNGASLSVEVSPSFFAGYAGSAGRGIWVYDGPDYNKVYPTRVSRPSREQVTPGVTWSLDATYRFLFPL
ncbi:hypothetical protein ACIBG8_34815 [Nonomuraea sp. NPDC050556]|uniref:hypothetical protein n=1 Tax=Nonomuraea sp. NPDC050556 TaxID=3364369 RepID=UPI0037A2866F